MRQVSAYRNSNMRQNQRFSNLINLQSFSESIYRMLAFIAVLTLLLVSNRVFAQDSIFITEPDFTAATCPIGHKMYSISNTSATTPNIAVWTPGSLSQNFTFEEPSSGNKIFTIEFPSLSIKDKNNTYGTTPFYGSISGATKNAINLVHNSPISDQPKANHTLSIRVNRSVSKMGYKIQDLDSTTVERNIGTNRRPIYVYEKPYIEQFNTAGSNGRLTFKSVFHTVNSPAPNTTTVTAIPGKNCGEEECTIDATWSYKSTNSLVSSEHINTKSEIDSPHAVAYSDFYFCLAPPKVLIKKQLNGARVNDNDQFEVKVTGGTVANNSFTTTGTGKTINNGNSSVISLAESTSYKITERVVNGTIGDIANYNATYTCSNATTGSTTAMPTAAMTYDAAAKTRSFTLANTNYGDEITCTITNTPSAYTFSGTVFNDNGGITSNSANRQNISSLFTSISEYFNGIFDRGLESGINDTRVQIRLANCTANSVGTTIATTLINSLGNYSFTLPKNSIAIGASVCLVEDEPAEWEYSIDTTANKRFVTIIDGKYTYDNLDFGEVTANNTSLVLIKSQYVHDCNTTLNYSDSAINQTTDNPRIGFSDQQVSDVAPNQCIAYRIEAYNRGHVVLNDVQITDPLQSAQSSFANPIPKGVPTNIYGTTMPTAKVITSNKFNLAGASSSATKATLYFNTKYGTTIDP